MQFRLLGQVQVRRGGRFEPPAGAVQSRLLAALLVRRNTVVTADALIAAVWPDPEPVSRNTLQVHLTQLRKLLREVDGSPPPALATSRAGYRLDVAAGQVDVEQFDALCASARAGNDVAHTVGALERALALWQEEPFAGLDLTPLLEQETTRLREQHAAAGELLVRSLVTAGRPAEAAAVAAPLLVTHPYREGLAAAFVVALYRLGRAGDALGTLRHFARRLDDDLGLRPGPELQNLQRHILTRSPALGGPEPAEAPAAMLRLADQSTTLFGRDADIATVSRLLAEAPNRIVSLLGPGGVGKSRLALAVTAAVGERYDAVVAVSLADVRDPDLALTDIVVALGVDDVGGDTATQSVERSVAGRRVLLVLDNLEHLLPIAGRLAEWLDRTPGLTVLTTSRAALRIRAEQEYAVQPLPVPERPGDDPAALDLLLDRAGRTGPDTAGERAALVDICRRCDGLPLALELAATRLRFMSVPALAESLRAPLAVLTSGPRDLPRRQRTLRKVLDWSSGLLGPVERGLLAQLTVFAAGADFADVQTVCEVESGADFAGTLERLVQHHVVAADLHAGRPRIRMLETVREYAQELLPADRLDRFRHRHAEHYLAMVTAMRPHIAAAVAPADIEHLQREHGNLRIALDRALSEHRLLDAAATAVIGAWGLWHAAGHIGEGRRWASSIRTADGELGDVARAELLVLEGALALYQADFDAALDRLDEGLEILLRHERHDWVARVYEARSTVHLLHHDIEGASSAAFKGLEHALRSRDDLVIGRARFQAGSVSVALGRLDEGRINFDHYLAAAQRVGSARDVAVAYGNLAAVAVFAGDVSSRAAECARSALVAAQGASSDPDMAFALEMNGLVALAEGRSAASEAYFRRALHIGLGAGHRYRVDRILYGLSAALAATSPADSVRLRAAADTLRARHGGSAMWVRLRAIYAQEQDAAAARLSAEDRAEAIVRGQLAGEPELMAEGRAPD